MNKDSNNFKINLEKKFDSIKLNDINKKKIKENIPNILNIFNKEELNNEKIEFNNYLLNLIKKTNPKLIFYLNHINNNIINETKTINLNNKNQNINEIILKEKKNIMEVSYSLSFNKNIKKELSLIENLENKIKLLEKEQYILERKKEEEILKKKNNLRIKLEKEKIEKEKNKSKENLDKRKKEIEDKEFIKHEKLLKLIDNYEEKRKKRKEIFNETNKKYWEIKKKKPLYIQMKEDLENNNRLNNDLAKKNIKNKYKQINYQDLIRHQNEIDSKITLKRGYNIKKFKSIDKFSQMNNNIKSIELDYKEKLLKRIEYSKNIIKNFKPKNLKSNLIEDKEKIKREIYWKELNEKIEKNKENGKIYLKESTRKNKLNYNNKKYITKEFTVKPNQSDFPDINNKNKTLNKIKYKNYLQELKDNNTNIKKINDIDKILKNDDIKKEDFEVMMLEISRLENRAKNRENLNKYFKKENEKNFEDVDRYYLDSIKAKLKIIEKCKKNIDSDKNNNIKEGNNIENSEIFNDDNEKNLEKNLENKSNEEII